MAETAYSHRLAQSSQHNIAIATAVEAYDEAKLELLSPLSKNSALSTYFIIEYASFSEVNIY